MDIRQEYMRVLVTSSNSPYQGRTDLFALWASLLEGEKKITSLKGEVVPIYRDGWGYYEPGFFLSVSRLIMQDIPFVPYNTSLTEYAKQNRKNPTKTEGIFRNFVLKNKKFL